MSAKGGLRGLVAVAFALVVLAPSRSYSQSMPLAAGGPEPGWSHISFGGLMALSYMARDDPYDYYSGSEGWSNISYIDVDLTYMINLDMLIYGELSTLRVYGMMDDARACWPDRIADWAGWITLRADLDSRLTLAPGHARALLSVPPFHMATGLDFPLGVQLYDDSPFVWGVRGWLRLSLATETYFSFALELRGGFYSNDGPFMHGIASVRFMMIRLFAGIGYVAIGDAPLEPMAILFGFHIDKFR